MIELDYSPLTKSLEANVYTGGKWLGSKTIALW